MRYLIWGTGQIATEKLSQSGIDSIINEIVAFVDNNKNKEGTFFFNKRIILPGAIQEIEFDKIIILCSYEAEIRNQIINELGFEEDRIWGQLDFNNMVCEMLIQDYEIFQKKILLVGDVKRYNQIKDGYNDLFQIVGIVDVLQLEEIEKYDYDYILLMNLMNITYLDRSMGRFKLERKVIHDLREKYNVSKPIFTHELRVNLFAYDRAESWGVDNIDKTYLVIRTGESRGLGACVTGVEQAVCYAIEKGYIPVVDMMTYHNQYLKKEEVGVVNAWEKFFEQPANVGMLDIANSKNILICTNKVYDTSKNKSFFFLKERQILWDKTNAYMEKIRPANEKILGVLVRGTDYVKRHPWGHYIQPDVDSMIKKVKEKDFEWGYFDKIYLCTEVEEVIVSFQKEFRERICFYPQRRVKEDFSEYLSEYKFDRDNDEYYRGEDYWVALKVLSKCDSLIAGKCAGTSVALKLNEKEYEHIYIFDLGRYGIDDMEN